MKGWRPGGSQDLSQIEAMVVLGRVIVLYEIRQEVRRLQLAPIDLAALQHQLRFRKGWGGHALAGRRGEAGVLHLVHLAPRGRPAPGAQQAPPPRPRAARPYAQARGIDLEASHFFPPFPDAMRSIRPPSSRRHMSMNTANMIISPTTISCTEVGAACRFRPVCTIVMVSAPNRVANTLPLPPSRLAPPMTAPAMAGSSLPTP